MRIQYILLQAMAHNQISDELVEVVVEGLQRRGAPGAARQDVLLHVRGSWMQLRWCLCVLKMSGMQRLSSNGMPPKVSSRCRLLGLTCPATTVEPPLSLEILWITMASVRPTIPCFPSSWNRLASVRRLASPGSTRALGACEDTH